MQIDSILIRVKSAIVGFLLPSLILPKIKSASIELFQETKTLTETMPGFFASDSGGMTSTKYKCHFPVSIRDLEASSQKRVLESEFSKASSRKRVLESEFSKASFRKRVLESEFSKVSSRKRVLESEFSKVSS
jgi:hypothetical protein